MKSLYKAYEAHPQWVQPQTFQRRFELRSDEVVYAELAFQSRLGSLAVALSADGRWTFKRVGFFRPHVTIREEGEEEDTAVYRPRWTGTEGQIEFADGKVYTWRTANFWAED